MIHYTYFVNGKKHGHSIVVHGYWGKKLVVNFGWGSWSAHKIIDTDGNSFTGFRAGTVAKTYTLRLR